MNDFFMQLMNGGGLGQYGQQMDPNEEFMMRRKKFGFGNMYNNFRGLPGGRDFNPLMFDNKQQGAPFADNRLNRLPYMPTPGRENNPTMSPQFAYPNPGISKPMQQFPSGISYPQDKKSMSRY